MSHPKLILFFFLTIAISLQTQAQSDSTLLSLQNIPSKYFSQVDKKVSKYSDRVTSKTEKTLSKLVRWENKVRSLLHKASPETEQRLFANKEMTFAGLQEKLQQGKKITTNVTGQYSEYRDKLSTGMRFITSKKEMLDSVMVKRAAVSNAKMDTLENDLAESEAVRDFIRERKKMLISESLKHIGKSKYLSKINKETYYYTETLKNYRELFSDASKREDAIKKTLSKIPAFKDFMKKNSMLASIFSVPADYGSPQSLAGLQTRNNVNALLQNRIAAGGPNAQDVMKQQLQAAQAELMKMKEKLTVGGTSTDDEFPDFKPNTQRAKTFGQRLEYGTNIQFSKNKMLPSTADVALTIGYKINDNSSAGLGMSYKLGMGSIQHISFSHQGVGLRSYLDWKLKKNIFISGGYELNHNSAFKKINELRDAESWQASGLIGLMKKIPFKSKTVKNTRIQVLYDILYRSHAPASQPVIFRVGYGF